MSDETPKLKLVSRNVETVTVRAYKVDMETYFRKMHLARGVEDLDIALISPDKNFEFAVPKYAKYQELENPLEVKKRIGYLPELFRYQLSQKKAKLAQMGRRASIVRPRSA